MSELNMETDSKKHDTPTDANNVLADSASFWSNADKSTVQNYLKENVGDMDEYNRKKQEIMKRCFERAEQRFEKPNGVSTNFFMWTMLAMAMIGLIAACLSS